MKIIGKFNLRTLIKRFQFFEILRNKKMNEK